MALSTRRDADLFARLLDGEEPPVADRAGRSKLNERPELTELTELAALARAIPRPALGPDPAFVARLRSELVEQADVRARALPADRTAARAAAGADARRDRSTSAPRTLVVRWPRRLVPTLAMTLAGLAVLVGGLSTRALPGDRLYDVKLGIGQAQVRLAGNDLARGQALLGQVDERLDEVDALVAAGDPRSSRVDIALTQAAVDLGDAQRVLLSTRDGRPDPEALRALADASIQATGRLRGIAPMLPTASGPELHRLLDLLAVGNAALDRQLTACGAPCADLRRELSALGQPGIAAAAQPGGSSGADPVGAQPRAPSAGLPSVAPTAAPTAPAPGATTVPGLPGVTVSVPGAGVTVPGVTTTSGGLLPSVSVPPVEATVGSLTASVSVPALTASTSTTTACVVDVTGLCIGG